MRNTAPIVERAYVPHPGPTLLAGVIVLAVGFWMNTVISGGANQFTGHGLGLSVLGLITLFAAAGSVDLSTQWWFSLVLGSAVIASIAVISVQMGTAVQSAVECLQYGLVSAMVFVGSLAIANSTLRFTAHDEEAEIDVERGDIL